MPLISTKGVILLRQEAQEVLDGLMLGDGSLGKKQIGVYYSMGLSKALAPHKDVTEQIREASLEEHLEYERWIRDKVFSILGIPIRNGHPRTYTSNLGGTPYKQAHLTTPYLPELEPLYNEWYKGGSWVTSGGITPYVRGALKVVPSRLMSTSILASRTLAHWFLGDGGVHRALPPTIYLSISTDGFTAVEVYHLMVMLNNMGILTLEPQKNKNAKKGAGLKIRVAQSSVNHFMDLVEPHVLEIFSGLSGLLYKTRIMRRLDEAVRIPVRRMY